MERRHSVRTYKDKNVSEEIVKDILWAANGVTLGTRAEGSCTLPPIGYSAELGKKICNLS